jgi:hypothetical protein
MFRDIAVNPPTVRALLLAGLAMMLGSPDTRANIVIDPDNILVTYFQSIREYTRDGTLVQSIPVPYPDEPRPGTNGSRTSPCWPTVAWPSSTGLSVRT